MPITDQGPPTPARLHNALGEALRAATCHETRIGGRTLRAAREAFELVLVDDGELELAGLLQLAPRLVAGEQVAGGLRDGAGHLAAVSLDQGLGVGAAATGE